jgi:hypothetical protein
MSNSMLEVLYFCELLINSIFQDLLNLLIYIINEQVGIMPLDGSSSPGDLVGDNFLMIRPMDHLLMKSSLNLSMLSGG